MKYALIFTDNNHDRQTVSGPYASADLAERQGSMITHYCDRVEDVNVTFEVAQLVAASGPSIVEWTQS